MSEYCTIVLEVCGGTCLCCMSRGFYIISGLFGEMESIKLSYLRNNTLISQIVSLASTLSFVMSSAFLNII